jgi:ribonuclease E
LVSIDVNSGKATKERHIEETAYKTNLEAAEEIARQVRLRDLAGLIVIDFIDMEESRNQSGVERRLKDALRADRARIQVGRISPFGLLEMSRQRLRPSLIETSTQPCAHCSGMGFIRSTESMALHVLRAIEEEGIRQRSQEITAYVPTAAALYVLNQKREILADIERRYGFRVLINADEGLIPPNMRIERTRGLGEDGGEPAEAAAAEGEREEDGKERRRRRSRRKGRDSAGERAEGGAESDETAAAGEDAPAQEARPDDDGEEQPRRRRRRGRRGGRRRARERGEATAAEGDSATQDTEAGPPADVAAQPEAPATDDGGGPTEADPAPEDVSASVDTAPDEPAAKKEKRPRRSRRSSKTKPKAAAAAESDEAPQAAEAPINGGDAEGGAADAPHGEAPPPDGASVDQPAVSFDVPPPEAQNVPDSAVESEPASPRRGWWRRLTEE